MHALKADSLFLTCVLAGLFWGCLGVRVEYVDHYRQQIGALESDGNDNHLINAEIKTDGQAEIVYYDNPGHLAEVPGQVCDSFWKIWI